jgi:hypothetical protein
MHVSVPSLPAEGIHWECAASPDALNPAHRVGDVCHAQEATGAVRGRRPRPSFSHARSALRRFAGLRVDGDEVVALRPHPPGDVHDRGPILGSQPSRPQRSRPRRLQGPCPRGGSGVPSAALSASGRRGPAAMRYWCADPGRPSRRSFTGGRRPEPRPPIYTGFRTPPVMRRGGSVTIRRQRAARRSRGRTP